MFFVGFEKIKLIKVTPRKMEASKMEAMIKNQSLGFMEDEIIHSHCDCVHCVNNTKPTPIPIPPREVSPK